MANNLIQLKTDLKTALTNNLDAATRTKLSNRFVSALRSEWDARIAAGTADNASNRATFIADKIFDYIQGIYQNESRRENQAALPVDAIV
jgi:hypothetical protein